MAAGRVRIIPILGTKNDVSQDDPSLYQMPAAGVLVTHDVGGVNFDLSRSKNACSKSYGKAVWSASATAEATKILGMYELYDGTNRNHIVWDNGKMYVYNAGLNPVDVTAAGVTHGIDDSHLISVIKVGAYLSFTDAGITATPYKWTHGDANATKLIASGTEFKFKFLEAFQRRVIGLYSDQTNGDIDLRWSTSWPGTAITSMNFPAANQLYIPNDDPATGIRVMGKDRCFVYSENSIHALDYYSDYEIPFKIRNVVDGQGLASNASIINLGDRHYIYNRNYGFCEFRGVEFPYGGKPISEDIEGYLSTINSDYYNIIVGTYIPLRRQCVWAMPLNGATDNNTLLFYNIDTGQWNKEDKGDYILHYLDLWQSYSDFTWNDLIAAAGGAGATWATIAANDWSYYTSLRQRLIIGVNDGNVYEHTGETDISPAGGSGFVAYRIEPILDFGSRQEHKYLREIWFDIGYSSNFDIEVYYRGGNTPGEVINNSWNAVGTISCNSLARPVLHMPSNVNTNHILHQIKWGTDLANERFLVNGIIFEFNTSQGTV
jgi:hypothetical protein